jgi:Delta7-sterol 5-desaturase
MLTSWIVYHWGWPGLFGFSLIFSLALYAIGAGLSYLWHFRLNRHRLMPDFVPDWRENRRAIHLSAISIAGNALFVLPIQLAIVGGYTRLYPAMERGWGWGTLAVIGAVLFAEGSIYWIHRALHTPTLFRWLHHRHHRFRMPTPFVSFAFHPLDDFAQSAPYHLYIFLVPMPELAYFALIGLAAVWTLLIHDRVVWISPRLINNSGCHTAHHWYYRHNYGNYFTFMDRLGGTYFDPAGLPDRFFAAKYGELERLTDFVPDTHSSL